MLTTGKMQESLYHLRVMVTLNPRRAHACACPAGTLRGYVTQHLTARLPSDTSRSGEAEYRTIPFAADLQGIKNRSQV